MLHMFLLSFVGKYCIYTECQRRSSRTMTSSFLGTFGRPYAPRSESSYFSPWRIIHKPTAKRKLPTAHSPVYFGYSSRRTSRSGRSAYLSPSSPTTEQDIQQPASPPSRSSTASILCHHWTFSLYHSKSASIWTLVQERHTPRRCMKIQGTPSSAKFNALRPSSTSTSTL